MADPDDPILFETQTNADGSVTSSASFDLTDARPVRDDVVERLDQALGSLGGEVMHAIDPRRIASFSQGGPPVWSVGIVQVAGAQPYTLLCTYGLSHVLSPEPSRDGVHHEYSLAVPAGVDPSPWADALLRHLARYVLSTGKDLKVGDVMPAPGPLTCWPFPPQHHASTPSSNLVGLVVAADPVMPRVETPHGVIEVRRIVGLEQDELDRAETWTGSGFVQEYGRLDPLLLSPPQRHSAMSHDGFAAAVNERAQAEGSEHGAVVVGAGWQRTDDALILEFNGGRDARKLLAALHGRIPFGRSLVVLSNLDYPPMVFQPADSFGLHIHGEALVISGSFDDRNFAGIIANIREDLPAARVTIRT